MDLLTEAHVQGILPHRQSDSNKGSFGKVLVIAGSANFPGAAILCCEGAMRVGAGLVLLFTTKKIRPTVTEKLSEVVFCEPEQLSETATKANAIIIGPGLGQDEHQSSLVKNFLQIHGLPPVVLDADALNILSPLSDWPPDFSFSAVLTPHPKEMSRLTGLSVESIQSDRERVAVRYSSHLKQTIVLKGANTAVANSDGSVKTSHFANPLLATAGTGDVLSGMIGGFIAQGLNTFDAACAAVFIHGQAAETLKAEYGQGGMLATDLLEQIPKTVKNIRESEK